MSRKKEDVVYVADPAISLLTYPQKEFIGRWSSNGTNGNSSGFALLLEPSADFYQAASEKPDKTNFRFLFQYLHPHKKLIRQLMFGLIAGSLIQLIFPFLTQSIVDIGISNQNIGFIYLILIAQLMLYTGRTAIDFLRGWILLHISTRINIALISDFLIKLMRLPVSFFDKKLTGDILQRINDHARIERFLTDTSLQIGFALINLSIFGIVLFIYNVKIFAVFLAGSILYGLWVKHFMKKRRALDHDRFSALSENQSGIIQLINGMQEIKINNAENRKRWEWEHIQTKLFKINVKNLSLNQYQQAGPVFINETKNIIVSFLAAMSVLNGEMTLGMMLAVQYIIGQMNSPVEQMIHFLRSAQDAKISLERMGEIHSLEDEKSQNGLKLREAPERKEIAVRHLSFSYSGSRDDLVLKEIDLVIEHQKTTAIVGPSGSGKTTLLKLLSGFYNPLVGEIVIDGIRLNEICIKSWRNQCGTVMQDGFIFSNTIADNIAISDEKFDERRLKHALELANLGDFISELPAGMNTRIGKDGIGLSRGQMQRILIARAVYKNPEILFFDEATNALDAKNERIIMNQLNNFFKNKTVVIIAHRLSTVKHADKIVVMDKGRIVEQGKHQDLIKLNGAYYDLVKNQLEL